MNVCVMLSNQSDAKSVMLILHHWTQNTPNKVKCILLVYVNALLLVDDSKVCVCVGTLNGDVSAVNAVVIRGAEGGSEAWKHSWHPADLYWTSLKSDTASTHTRQSLSTLAGELNPWHAAPWTWRPWRGHSHGKGRRDRCAVTDSETSHSEAKRKYVEKDVVREDCVLHRDILTIWPVYQLINISTWHLWLEDTYGIAGLSISSQYVTHYQPVLTFSSLGLNF